MDTLETAQGGLQAQEPLPIAAVTELPEYVMAESAWLKRIWMKVYNTVMRDTACVECAVAKANDIMHRHRRRVRRKAVPCVGCRGDG